MKNGFPLIFLHLIIISGSAQNFISGTVIDKESKALIELVTVGIVGKGIGTNSNGDGKCFNSRIAFSEPRFVSTPNRKILFMK